MFGSSPIEVWLLVGFVLFFALAIPRRHSRQTGQMLAKLLAVAVAIAVAAKFFSAVGSHHIQFETARIEVPEVHRVTVPEVPRAPAPSSNVTPDASPTDSESVKSSSELPEWTKLPVRMDGSRKLFVVSSGRFATEEEAELHGLQDATAAAVKEYASLDPNGRGAVQPQHSDIVKDKAIKLQHKEVIQFDFGKFQAPMYQLWMQLELTPELGERLAEPWRQAAVDARLRTLGGWCLWGTAAAALAAFALRIDSAWNGRYRAVVAGATIALALGGLAFLA